MLPNCKRCKKYKLSVLTYIIGNKFFNFMKYLKKLWKNKKKSVKIQKDIGGERNWTKSKEKI